MTSSLLRAPCTGSLRKLRNKMSMAKFMIMVPNLVKTNLNVTEKEFVKFKTDDVIIPEVAVQ